MYKLIVVLALAVCAQARIPGAPFKTGGRIFNGSQATPGQIPYQAFVLLFNLQGQKFGCGGSLISPDWVLTAAVCVSGYIIADVHLGSITWEDSPVVLKSSNLVAHPSFSPIGLKNNIGLIGLPKSVPFSDNIKPIALAVDPSISFSGREGLVSGFGITKNDNEISPSLLFAPVKVITNFVCLLNFPIYVRDSVLCTRGVHAKDQGFCDGDIGGPLVLVEGGELRQIGVASFTSSKGCHKKHPRGYAKPSHYLHWITVVTGITFH